MFINVNEGFKNCAKFNKLLDCELPQKGDKKNKKEICIYAAMPHVPPGVPVCHCHIE